jgi:hemerythrin superfamily protein
VERENVMSTDAIVILKRDHRRIRVLFKKFQSSSPGAHVARGDLVDQSIQELTVHTYIENEVMYPNLRELHCTGGRETAGRLLTAMPEWVSPTK